MGIFQYRGKSTGIGGERYYTYNPATGEREILVAAEEIIPEGADEPLEVSRLSLVCRQSKITCFYQYQESMEVPYPGYYWVLDQDTRDLRKLGRGLHRKAA